MTPESKANELIQKYFNLTDHMTWEEAKRCALIAVDEIILEWQEVRGETVEARKQIIEKISYWRKVKVEIELL